MWQHPVGADSRRAVALAAGLYLQDDSLSTADWKLVGLELLASLGVWAVPNAARKSKN